MTDSPITEYAFNAECEMLANDILAEFIAEAGDEFADDSTLDDMRDRAHETADGHQWVIYTHYCREIYAACDLTRGEEFLEDVGMPETPTLDGLITIVVYAEMRARIEECLQERHAELAGDWESGRDAREEVAGARSDASDAIAEFRAGDLTRGALSGAIREARETIHAAIASRGDAGSANAWRAGWQNA